MLKVLSPYDQSLIKEISLVGAEEVEEALSSGKLFLAFWWHAKQNSFHLQVENDQRYQSTRQQSHINLCISEVHDTNSRT